MNHLDFPYIKPALRKSTSVISGFSLASGDLEQSDMGINTRTSLQRTSQNRRLFTKLSTGKSVEPAYLKQVHGNDIVYADRPGRLGEGDGLITNHANLPLAILVADCAAILLSDGKNRVIGALHAGWRGAVEGIVPKGIQNMRELGAHQLSAWISPCISTHAFEVGKEVAEQFPSAFVFNDGYDKPRVDLRSFIEFQLVQNGVKSRNIHSDERCTVSDRRFFSYRRQGFESGRMMAVIMLNS